MSKVLLTAADLRALLLKAEKIEDIKQIAADAIEALVDSDLKFAAEKTSREASDDKLKIVSIALKKSEDDAEGALETIAELGKKFDLLEKNRGDNSLIVTIGKKDYKILGNRFITPNGELTAEELSKDKAELKRMLEIGSGSLVEFE